MNLATMPGPGDESTWGPICGSNDPRYEGRTGWLLTTMQLGLGSALVSVTFHVTDDDVDHNQTTVCLSGLDITESITADGWSCIDSHIQSNWAQIVRENQTTTA